MSASSILEHADTRVVIGTASYVCYLIYKQFEPKSVATHVVLLLLSPFALVYTLSARLSLFQQFFAVFCCWGLILVWTSLYRLSPIHPLAKYPGPTLGKLSKFYWAYLNVRGDAYIVLKDWHDRHGDVIRFGPNELSFRRVDAIQPIYASKLLPKGPYYDTRTHPDGTTQLDGLRDYNVHGSRRKAWTLAMSTSALKDYEHIIREKTNELMDGLSKHQGKTVDLSHWMNLFGFDFMGRMAFDRDFGMLRAGKDVGGAVQVIEEGVLGAAIISHVPWTLPILQYIPPAQKGYKALQNLCLEISSERTAKSSTAKDLYYFLTEDAVTSQRQSATPKEIVADGILAIVAGSDTTSILLSHLWYFLLRHPDCADRLQKEIDAAFPHGEDPMDFFRHVDMRYLNACINEALRLLPPTLSGLQRMVPRGSGGAMIGPYFVPENTQVSIHIYAMHRDAREFSPLPDTFWPDRWLTQDSYTLPSGDVVPKEQVVTNRAAYMPFSVGPQNCAGKALALAEMRAVTCALLQKFELRKDKGYDLDRWERELVDAYVTLKGELPVVLVPRHA